MDSTASTPCRTHRMIMIVDERFGLAEERIVPFTAFVDVLLMGTSRVFGVPGIVAMLAGVLLALLGPALRRPDVVPVDRRLRELLVRPKSLAHSQHEPGRPSIEVRRIPVHGIAKTLPWLASG